MNIEGGDQRQISPSETRFYRPEVSPDGSRVLAEFNNSLVVYRLNNFTPDPVAFRISLRTSQDGAWSPDGNRIAFVSFQNDKFDIFVMNISTGEITQVTDSPSADRYPTWSPDGQSIAFTSNRDGNWEIYIMDLVGNRLIRLTEDPGYDTNPVWSPAY
jgi:TolB protein